MTAATLQNLAWLKARVTAGKRGGYWEEMNAKEEVNRRNLLPQNTKAKKKTKTECGARACAREGESASMHNVRFIACFLSVSCWRNTHQTANKSHTLQAKARLHKYTRCFKYRIRNVYRRVSYVSIYFSYKVQRRQFYSHNRLDLQRTVVYCRSRILRTESKNYADD